MEAKQIKIEVPQGYEIDKEKSTFENIILKPIEDRLPLSVKEILDRSWYISSTGKIKQSVRYINIDDVTILSTENRAKAFLALMQLVELRDAWNGDWRADWENESDKYCIIFLKDKKMITSSITTCSCVLNFKTKQLAEKFAEQFKDLINEAQELL